MTDQKYTQKQSLPDFDLWRKKSAKNALYSFTLELTARCNNNCRHCYINLPEDDTAAQAKELTFEQIKQIVDQAVDQGAFWCLITGGEPLLRDDFEDIYLYLKRKGLLVTVFTNATLIGQKHIDLFKKYPPRDLEISVYGLTPETYAAVTRKPKLFTSFLNGLNLLLENGIRVNLKNVTIRANRDEFNTIAAYCRQHSRATFRFDPFIHLRLDRNEKKNEEIRRQRLTAEEIAALESSDEDRHNALQKNCDQIIRQQQSERQIQHVFGCGAGLSDFVVSWNGHFRVCSSLWHPEFMTDLRSHSLQEARETLIPQIRSLQSTNAHFLQNCAICTIVNLCIWCPAHAYLESGQLDKSVSYFCDVAHCRSNNIKNP